MRIYRCPRCLAEDISADAHPARILRGAEEASIFVCRSCYRAAELQFRIACETQGVPYAPLTLREGLRRLAGFYRERLEEAGEPALSLEGRDRQSDAIRTALDDVERRLRIEALE